MRLRALLALIAAVLTGHAAPDWPSAPSRPGPGAVLKRLRDTRWVDLPPPGGLPPNAGVLMGRHFAEDKTVMWTAYGEMEVDWLPPARIDVTTDPWQLDCAFPSCHQGDARQYAVLGIFRFEGDKLVWVTGEAPWIDPETWPREGGKLPGRPTNFAPAPGAKQGRLVLKPTDAGAAD